MTVRRMHKPTWMTGIRHVSWIIGVIVSITLNPLAHAEKPALGEPAPNFTLHNDSPFNLRLSEQKGQIVVVVFWSSWCRSCNDLLESLRALETKFAQYGVKVWSITLDKNPEDARQFDQQRDLGLTILYDDTFFVSEQYDIEELPSTAIIDRDGVIRYLHDGYENGDIGKLDELLQKLVLE